MPAPTTWADVLEGDRVEDKGGRTWTVAKIANKPKTKQRVISLEDGEKTASITVSVASEVKIVEKALPSLPGVDPQELAAAVVQSRLGGEVILTDGPDYYGVPKCPREFLHPGARLAHLYTMHGIKNPKLDSPHEHEGGPGYLTHTHEDTPQ